MAVHGWLLVISGLLIVTTNLVSSELQKAARHNKAALHNNAAAVPHSICSGDFSFTKGYRCQDYDVITEDGYILKLWRFREGLTKESQMAGKKKQPVFVQHGVLMNGQCWFLVAHADQSLPLVLVEHGYDVWVSNSRGTSYSQRHVSSNNLSLPGSFWDFTYSEMASYDLPAFLNFVYLETGQKVHYIGHSQGTTMMFAAFSIWKVEERVKSTSMIAPVVYLNHMPFGLIDVLAKAYIGEIAGTFGLADLNIMTQPLGTIVRVLCDVPGVDCFGWIVSLFTGMNCCMNASTVDLWFASQPQPTSIKNLVHWAQGVRKQVFAQYDYGDAATNLEHYGKPEPPSYNLLKIPKDFPLFLIYGGLDLLAIRKDVHILLGKLGSNRNIRELYIDNYAHLDFLEAVNAKDLVYPDIINFIKGIP
ncbi:LICH hydrolase [Heracleum sosnowskyi]|uniref:Lipase n=1 Tax=Heracleum sosnowskyi TaxID=360622 RepID=A0AAD8HIE6_9APIA|nr:LICH hydrolase [Heracleum sosnowskyi]